MTNRPPFQFGLIVTTAVLLAASFTQTASTQDQSSIDPHPRPLLEKQVQSVLAAKDYRHAAFAYVDAERLHLLQAGQSDSIAIQAAWEQIERTIPEKPGRVVRPHRDG
jgi:hypothetical protein